MPQINFDRPMTFINALEQFSLGLHCVMVALRDEANFHDSQDNHIYDAAVMLTSMLEDSHAEADTLMRQLEMRVRGMDA